MIYASAAQIINTGNKLSSCTRSPPSMGKNFVAGPTDYSCPMAIPFTRVGSTVAKRACSFCSVSVMLFSQTIWRLFLI